MSKQCFMILKHSDDISLRQDVFQFFSSHSINIENVDQIIQCKKFALSVKNDIDIDIDLFEFYDELYKWKTIAQLLLNLYNNYDFFCNSEVSLKNKEIISNLIEDDDISLLRENFPPSEDIVIEALYRYLLYFLIIRDKEYRSYLRQISGNNGLDNVKCYVCDNSLHINHLDCSVCQEPIENTVNMMKEFSHVKKSVEISKDKRKETDFDIFLNGNKVKDVISGKVEENQYVSNIDINLPMKFENSERLNENGNVSFMKCKKSSRDEMTCQNSTLYNDKPMKCDGNKNSIEMKYCEKCGDDDEICDKLYEICLARSLRWKCWYRFCMNENDGGDEYCKHCGLDRHADRTNVTTVDRFKDGRRDKIWICDKCDAINEDCMKFTCIKCGLFRFVMRNNNTDDNGNGDSFVYLGSMENEKINKKRDDCSIPIDKWTCYGCQCLNDGNLITCMACFKSKLWTCKECGVENKDSNNRCVACGYEREFCVKCKKNEIVVDELCKICSDVPTKWDCWYVKCGKRNYNDDKCCSYCALERYPMHGKGAPVWQHTSEGLIQKWICDKCSKINNATNDKCENYRCEEPRNLYFKWCHFCGFGYDKGWLSISKCAACKKTFN